MPESSREEIAKLEALYANNPAGRVFTHLAEAYRKAGELERARGILDDGLAKHPGYASAYVVLGRVLIDLHETDSATEAFKRVLDLDPNNLIALRSLGELARGAGRGEDARRYFEELRQQDPGNDEIDQILSDLDKPVTEAQSVTVEYEASASDTAESVDFAEAERPREDEGESVPSAWYPPIEEAEPVVGSDAPDDEAPKPAAVPGAEDTGEDYELGWLAESVESSAAEEGELGDISSLGAANQPFEVVGETFAFEEINLTAEETSQPEAGAGDSAPAGDGEVLTETIAELYSRQGLFERAADVYRGLIREHPDDESLRIRLAEVESLMRGDQEMPPAVVDEWREPEPWESSEADTEEEAAWLAVPPEPVENTPTPYAWTELAGDAPSDTGQPISAYFQTLLAWQPRAPESSVSSVPGTADQSTSSEQAFDEWFGGRPETAAADQPTASAEVAPQEAGASEIGDAADEDDDDDLEMFRSWLQSLKK